MSDKNQEWKHPELTEGEIECATGLCKHCVGKRPTEPGHFRNLGRFSKKLSTQWP